MTPAELVKAAAADALVVSIVARQCASYLGEGFGAERCAEAAARLQTIADLLAPEDRRHVEAMAARILNREAEHA